MSATDRFADEMYLTQFCHEEARHTEAFRRWMDAVGLTGDLRSFVAENPHRHRLLAGPHVRPRQVRGAAAVRRLPRRVHDVRRRASEAQARRDRGGLEGPGGADHSPETLEDAFGAEDDKLLATIRDDPEPAAR
jgi:hypothetical protein